MRKFAKPLHIMLAVQAFCLLIGLWLHGQFLITSAKWNVNSAIWKQLGEWSDQSATFVGRWQNDGVNSEDWKTDATDRLAKSIPIPTEIGVLLVDSSWRVLDEGPQTAAQQKKYWSQGEALNWKSDASLSNENADSIQGTIETSQGTRLALARRLKEPNGYLIVYHNSNGELHAADIIEAMPATGAITFIWTFGLQCIVAYLMLSRVNIEHSRKQMRLEEESLQRKSDLVRTRDAVIFGLAKLAESRDPDTGHHLERISLYSTRLASELPRYEKYKDVVTPGFIQLIGISSALHDIGKVGVEDAILLKPSSLTADERSRMQHHAEVGGQCIREIEQRLGKSNFLQMAREIALYHHERWDGSGYPNGLVGENIPLPARIVSIADVYDALSVQRVYKVSIPHERCVEIIRNEAGKQFDPHLVDIFLKIESQLKSIARRFADKTDFPASRRQYADRPETDSWLSPVQEEALIAATKVDEEEEAELTV